MDDLKKYLGPLALFSVVGYFMLNKNEKEKAPALDGINIDIDADKIVDSIKSKLHSNPKAQQAIGYALKGIVTGYLAGQDDSINDDDESEMKDDDFSDESEVFQ